MPLTLCNKETLISKTYCSHPMEEDGGSNLYAFVGNNPINNVDLLGLEIVRYRMPDDVAQEYAWLNAVCNTFGRVKRCQADNLVTNVL